VLLFAINEWFVGSQSLGIGDRGHDGQDGKKWLEIVGRAQKALDIDIIIKSMSLDIKGGSRKRHLIS
jgi:hypothetical protein